MNPYPNKGSVLVMDGEIHYDDEMVDLIEKSGCRVLYLSPFSPDFNPAETAFSTVKTWIRKNRSFIEACKDPEYGIMVAFSQISPGMARSYFEKSNYI
jgi:transposase